jgi:hypothetical protein
VFRQKKFSKWEETFTELKEELHKLYPQKINQEPKQE